MALIRGVRSHFPCPICLVPQDLQWDISKEFPFRTQADSRNIFLEAMDKPNIEQRDAHLKKYGLRAVEVSLIYHRHLKAIFKANIIPLLSTRMHSGHLILLTFMPRFRMIVFIQMTTGCGKITFSQFSRTLRKTWVVRA
jgi:hypothetical protein